MFIALIVFALFASTFALGQAALCFTQPAFLIAVRMMLAGLIMLGYLFFFKPIYLRMHKKEIDYKLFILLGFFHIYIPYVTEFWGLQGVGSAKAALLYSVTPFVTAYGEWLLFGVRLTRYKLLGIIIGVVGLLPILFENALCEGGATHVFGLFSWYEIAILVSAITASFGWLLLKKSVVEKKHSVLLANGSAMLLGGIFSLITSIFVESWHPVPMHHYGRALFYIGLLIIIGNFLYYNLYGLLLKKYSATFLSLLGFTIPIFAAIYQWCFFKQPVGPGFMYTLGATIVGLFIFYYDEMKHKKA